MIKKLIIFLVILLFLAGALSYLSVFLKLRDKTSVLGIAKQVGKQNMQEEKNGNNRENISFSGKSVNDVFERVKENISRISAEDIASSSPQVQKILNDLKSIQESKKEPKDYICDLVCAK